MGLRAKVAEQFKKYQYPDSVLTPLIYVEVVCAILYLIPRTAVLGAILLTGYLGGATATHVRVGEPFFLPIIFAVVLWLGIFLRDRRVRDLVPFRR
jgi:DoxX-like family